MMGETFTKFDYLLNAVDHAAQAEHPAVAGYAGKRRLLLEHVRALEKDAERYRKLAAAATEQLLHPDRARCEMMPDRRTHWKLPVLMCSGPVGGFVSFADAVDALHNFNSPDNPVA
jgi:hypothetical protein